MRGHECPQCGGPLQEVAYPTGSVWQCSRHGVKDWFFEAGRGDRLRLDRIRR